MSGRVSPDFRDVVPSRMLTCSAPTQQLPSIGAVEGGGKDTNPDGLHFFSKCTPVDLDNLVQPLQTPSPEIQSSRSWTTHSRYYIL